MKVSLMRAVLAGPFVIALAVAPAAAQRADVDYWATLEAWVGAIESHEPGRNDEAVLVLASIPAQVFEATIPYMVYLLDRAQGQRGTRAFDDLFRRLSGDMTLGTQEALRLRALINTVRARGLRPSLNRAFLKRAAMLHTDTTLYYPEAQRTTAEGVGRIAADGRTRGDLGRPWHWMLARAFLHLSLIEWIDARTPRLVPDADPDVRLWYQAVANHLWSARNYTESLPHIRRALELFPDDAEIRFVSGLIHESQSGSHIQAAVADQIRLTRRRGVRYSPSVRSAEKERGEAEREFRRALDADPHHLEARLHLAHVLTIDGKFDDAVKELALVLAGVTDPWHRYFALLFLGRAEEGRGRPAEACDAYTRASELFPDAQAPRVAISQIDLRAGDRASAMDVFTFLAAPRGPNADPWWFYDAIRFPDAGLAWIERARAAFRASAR